MEHFSKKHESRVTFRLGKISGFDRGWSHQSLGPLEKHHLPTVHEKQKPPEKVDI